jgi:hypothetical protein
MHYCGACAVANCHCTHYACGCSDNFAARNGCGSTYVSVDDGACGMPGNTCIANGDITCNRNAGGDVATVANQNVGTA